MPAIGRFMTQQPWTIHRAEPLVEAHRMMRARDIRHLPVLDGDRLVGMVSMHDLQVLETIAEFPLEGVVVDDAMHEPPYVVSYDTPLDDVADQMARHKRDAAIVIDEGGGVVGIFTVVDACRALSDLLRAAP